MHVLPKGCREHHQSGIVYWMASGLWNGVGLVLSVAISPTPPPTLPWDLEQTNLFLSECQDPAISAHSASAIPTLHMDIHSLILVCSVASH